MHGFVGAVWLSIGTLCHGDDVSQKPRAADDAITLRPGPYLLLDDFLIEGSTNLKRTVNRPRRDLTEPIVTGREDKNGQPWVTVLRDPVSGRFRMWYNATGDGKREGLFALGYLESTNGIHWIRPHRALAGPPGMLWGSYVMDEGPRFPDAELRYKFGWWCGDGTGLKIAASPDGLDWKLLTPTAVVKSKLEICYVFRDPVRSRYCLIQGHYTTGDAWKGYRRVSLESVSDDLVHWKEPWTIISPIDTEDEGETQFYSIGGVLPRGQTLVGMLKVLRDDLPADPGDKVAGLGYTVLAWSHDGEHWQRDREPFIDRNHDPGTWDHAMTWVDCQLPVGDDVFLYYGGYARGHKIEPTTERQIGLVRLKRDRYVSRDAGDTEGLIRTKPLTIEASSMSLNVDASTGTVRAQLTDRDGKPLTGFSFADMKPIRGDSLAAPLAWKRPLSDLRGHVVRLDIALRNANLFAIELK